MTQRLHGVVHGVTLHWMVSCSHNNCIVLYLSDSVVLPLYILPCLYCPSISFMPVLPLDILYGCIAPSISFIDALFLTFLEERTCLVTFMDVL